AVVLEDVPPYAVVVGVPGKVKKYRFTPRQIKILEAVRWWDWSDDEIRSNMEYILEPELFFEKYTGLVT
ncbi:MAG: aminocyclitol acetyltransferase ApmA, partial [Candidatus Accumulibacter sp.]|nr:aminocyclitol acetyltransferase ApmA [Accumulibacter sp.]